MQVKKIFNFYTPEIETFWLFFLQKTNLFYIVGGFVRDFISLQIKVKDVDFATNLPVQEVLAGMADFVLLYGGAIVQSGVAFGSVSLYYRGYVFDVTTFRRDLNFNGRHADVLSVDSVEQDASRRDFTINALYLDLHGNIYDFYNGLNDLEACRVMFIGDPETRIHEDYLRIFRYFRFCVRFDAVCDHKILSIFSKSIPLIQNLSKERITTEVLKICSYRNSEKYFVLMWECGLLNYIFRQEVVFDSNLFSVLCANLDHSDSVLYCFVKACGVLNPALYFALTKSQKRVFALLSELWKRSESEIMFRLLKEPFAHSVILIDILIRRDCRERFVKKMNIVANSLFTAAEVLQVEPTLGGKQLGVVLDGCNFLLIDDPDLSRVDIMSIVLNRL